MSHMKQTDPDRLRILLQRRKRLMDNAYRLFYEQNADLLLEKLGIDLNEVRSADDLL